jgi:hypothetical protein
MNSQPIQQQQIPSWYVPPGLQHDHNHQFFFAQQFRPQ